MMDNETLISSVTEISPNFDPDETTFIVSAEHSPEHTTHTTGTDNPVGPLLYILIGAGVGLLLLILLIVFICCWTHKRRKRRRQNFRVQDLPTREDLEGRIPSFKKPSENHNSQIISSTGHGSAIGTDGDGYVEKLREGGQYGSSMISTAPASATSSYHDTEEVDRQTRINNDTVKYISMDSSLLSKQQRGRQQQQPGSKLQLKNTQSSAHFSDDSQFRNGRNQDANNSRFTAVPPGIQNRPLASLPSNELSFQADQLRKKQLQEQYQQRIQQMKSPATKVKPVQPQQTASQKQKLYANYGQGESIDSVTSADSLSNEAFKLKTPDVVKKYENVETDEGIQRLRQEKLAELGQSPGAANQRDKTASSHSMVTASPPNLYDPLTPSFVLPSGTDRGNTLPAPPSHGLPRGTAGYVNAPSGIPQGGRPPEPGIARSRSTVHQTPRHVPNPPAAFPPSSPMQPRVSQAPGAAPGAAPGGVVRAGRERNEGYNVIASRAAGTENPPRVFPR